MSVLARNCRGLGSTSAMRLLTEEVRSKNPTLVFLVETKAQPSRIKGLQQKLELTQGIVVPSDGRSGSLTLLWKEGTMVHFKAAPIPILMWWWWKMMVEGRGGRWAFMDIPT